MASCLIAVASFICCGKSQEYHYVDISLSDVEMLISFDLDSAFSLLDNSDLKYMRNQEAKARYSLYISLAKFRKDGVITSDSIIRPAVEFFLTPSDETACLRERMLTYFLYGNYYLHTHADSVAFSMFDQVIDLGIQLHDPDYPALAMRAEGIALCREKHYQQGEEKFFEAISYLDQNNGKDEIRAGILLELAKSFNSIDSFEKSQKYINEALQILEVNRLTIYLPELSEEMAATYFYANNFAKANEWYEKSNSYNHPLSYMSYTYWAISALLSDNPKGIQLRDSIRTLSTNSTEEKLLKLSMEKTFAHHENNFEKYIQYTDSIIRIQDQELLSRIYSTPSIDYNSTKPNQYNQNPTTESNRSKILIAVIAICVFIASIVLVVLRFKRKHPYIEHSHHSLNVDNQKSTELSVVEAAEINSHIETDSDKSSEPADLVSSINNLHEKYQELNRLFSTGSEWKTNLSPEDIKKGTKLINSYMNPKSLNTLISDIDEAKENIASYIIEEFNPDFKNKKVILLSLCGVNYKAIAVLSNDSPSAVASRISRQKKLIYDSESEHRDLYRKYIY